MSNWSNPQRITQQIFPISNTEHKTNFKKSAASNLLEIKTLKKKRGLSHINLFIYRLQNVSQLIKKIYI